MAQSLVKQLIGNRPLSARSVLASALLGSDESRLTAGELINVASLFGISAGATRTCLWRMVSAGELSADDGNYALAGRLLERRERVDEASRMDDAAEWDGTWELAIVSLERRPAAERLELRKAAIALHLAELREGVWLRPDNLDSQRLPGSRAVLDRQCIHFHGAATDISPDQMRSLFSLDEWAADAEVLIEAMNLRANKRADSTQRLADEFALSIAVVRHLQLDPQLPAELIPARWPGHTLRDTYRRFDEAFKQRMSRAYRG
ncbi:transcriptional regulator [Mycobacterium sp. 1164966.3]|uniref:PaaX family transcriptional regulator C-terminal domain-containing protein n=1 Tax=Mycobacterium sp. 1164966.3 TaxID=1856861 RepID=UPI0007FB71C0|nr:PaaX family transcriptional regulator C-terminal domain-containing protein [Mycobacterium sp. 1164966.3]OBA84065.1 transcriptional regulator [Mycobacterium sp. 1164966.3]